VKLGDASYAIYLVHLPVLGGLWRLGVGFGWMVVGGVVAGLAYHALYQRIAERIRIGSGRALSTSPACPPSYIPNPSFRPLPARRAAR
jgi:peptidoglycan/LPS O-acetylase OafA/YrhL